MKKIFIIFMLLCALSLFGERTVPETLSVLVSDPYLLPVPSNVTYGIGSYTVNYDAVNDSLNITYYNGCASRQVYPVYELNESLKTGEYKEYEIYYEVIINSPGAYYSGNDSTDDGGYITDRYFKVIMLDTLFNQLITKRVKYEAEKLLRSNCEGRDSCKIKSIYTIDRLEERTTVYEETK